MNILISNKRLILKCIFNNEINELACTRSQAQLETTKDPVFTMSLRQIYYDKTTSAHLPGLGSSGQFYHDQTTLFHLLGLAKTERKFRHINKFIGYCLI